MVSGGKNENPEICENEEIVIRATDPELVVDERKIPSKNSKSIKVAYKNSIICSY